MPLLNNETASRHPKLTDDINAGYSPGSKWIYGDSVWFCVSADSGIAEWGRIMAPSIDFPDELNFLLELAKLGPTV